MKPRLPQQTDDTFDLTPMIDIVFLLIFFFMTVAKVIADEKIPVELPIATQSVIPDELGTRQTVSIQADGTLYAGIRTVTLEELTEIVRQGNLTYPGFKVFIRADAATPHQFVRDAMKACADAGAYDIVFGVYQSDK